MLITLDRINTAHRADALALLEPLVENSPEVVDKALADHPFATLPDLEAAILGALYALSPSAQIALFRRHPALAGQEAQAGTMTRESQSEQGRLGLDRLSGADLARLDRLNTDYAARFGYPFILALVCVGSLAEVFAIFDRRLRADPVTERRETLDQIATVIRSRIDRTFGRTPAVTPPTRPSTETASFQEYPR